MASVLSFRLFDMPVTVRGSFLLIAAFLGFSGINTDVAFALALVGVIFVSILVHELAHAFTARGFGAQVAIELNGLGGLTRWSSPDGELTPGRRALVAAAGSATGLVFGGLVWLLAAQFGPYSPLTASILNSIVTVNVLWGLLNWLPIRPLDGGHLLESFLERFLPQRAEAIARVVFTATAAGAVVFALSRDMLILAILGGWLLLSELTAGRQTEPPAGLPTLSYDVGDGQVNDGQPVDMAEPEDDGERHE